MKKRIYYFLLFIYIAVGHSNAETANRINETQARNLISAAWKRPATSIDVMIYKEVKKRARNIELIRKEVERELKEVEQQFENLKNEGIIIEKIDLENEVKKRVAAYNQPKLFKEQIRIDGYLYRLDQTSIKSDINVGPEVDVHRTYVNCGNKEKNDYTHFCYDHEYKQAIIDNSKKTVWREHRVNEWIGIPKEVSELLKKASGTRGSESGDDTLIPSIDAIPKLINGEIDGFGIEFDEAEIDNHAADKIIMTLGPQNKKVCCLIVDKEDYSRVHNYEIYNLLTGSLLKRREAKEFDEEGYPRQIYTITYNNLGKIIEEERIVVENVDLEPVLSDDLFKFNVPSGYTMIDDRLSPALIVKAFDEMESIESDKFLDESSLPKVQTKGDKVSIENGNNKTSNDKGNINANKLTDDTEGTIEQEKQIKDAKTNYRLYFLITLFVLGFILAFIYKHKRT